MAIATSGILGVSLAVPDVTGQIALGTKTNATDGQVCTYVSAGSAITAGQWLGIDENFLAYPLTSAMAKDGWYIAVATTAVAAGSEFWAVGQGGVNAKVGASCAADVALYTSATAGVLDDTATTIYEKIDGVVLVAANASASIRTLEVLLTFPRATTF
jgi:hypothetical protein